MDLQNKQFFCLYARLDLVRLHASTFNSHTKEYKYETQMNVYWNCHHSTSVEFAERAKIHCTSPNAIRCLNET